MPSYYDDWKDANYKCANCSWSGIGRELPRGETFRDLFEVECPKCGARLGTIIPYPGRISQEWDRVSPADRALVELAESRQADFEQRCLRSPDQLPDLLTNEIVLTWDFVEANGRETVLRHGERELWREPAFYEGYMRFIEVVTILVQKYGARLRDVVPAEDSEFFLYGDKIAAPSAVDRCRHRLKTGNDAV